jgi:hypothetical protein
MMRSGAAEAALCRVSSACWRLCIERGRQLVHFHIVVVLVVFGARATQSAKHSDVGPAGRSKSSRRNAIPLDARDKRQVEARGAT